jgi:hypothetical protein
MSTIIIEGIYRDRLISPQGIVVFDSDWRSNMIVLQGRRLLAGFMKNEATAHGIQSLNIGSGLDAWDTTPPPLPDAATVTDLVTPIFTIPVADLLIQYLDASDAPTNAPSNRIQITSTLGVDQPTPAGQPPAKLREFGLFGTLNNSPFMIDYIRHPLIEKEGSVTLERKVRLIF